MATREKQLAPRTFQCGQIGGSGVAMRVSFDEASGEEPLILVFAEEALPGMIEQLASFLPKGMHGNLVVHDDRSLQEIATRRLAPPPAAGGE